MTTRVVVTTEAAEQIRNIDGWWRRERPAAPCCSPKSSLAHSFIAGAPQAGRLYPHATVSEVRRILLRSSRFHVYYKIHEDDVIILAVWSAVRGSGPEIK